MEMTDNEICRMYREAKKKKSQIRILADLNDCDKKKIERILVNGGEIVEYNVEEAKKIRTEEIKVMQVKPEIPMAVSVALMERMTELDMRIARFQRLIAMAKEEKQEIERFIDEYVRTERK